MGIEFTEPDPSAASGGMPVIASEFADVSVTFDNEGNSPRLRLCDLRTGRERFLDALELETVIWLPDEHLTALMDPSHGRWRGEE